MIFKTFIDMQFGFSNDPTQHGPGVDHYLQVEVLPVHLLGVAVVDPLGARDVGQVLQHDQVLALNTRG